MAKKIKSKSRVEEDARANNNIKEASRLTEISRKLLGMSDDTYQIKSDIELQTSRFDKIINQNLDVIKGVSGGSILDFAQNARINEMRTPRGGISPTNSQDLRKMLSGNSGPFSCPCYSLRSRATVWASSERGKDIAVAGNPSPTHTVRRRCVPPTSGCRGSRLVGEHGLSARKG